MLNFNDLIAEYNTPEGLSKMLDSLDIITLNHSVRVCQICKVVEKELDFKDKLLSEAGLYHDIGKYFITTKLLNKRGKLTKIERVIIDSHAYLSYKVLKFFDIDDTVCLIALYHHRFNPDIFYDEDKVETALIDTDVARLARAIKTIDIYEALTTDRPYHRGVSSDKSIEIIINTIPDCDLEVLRAIKLHEKEIEE